MSVETLNAFVNKVANDEAFRDAVIVNPVKELANWDLSEEELDSIKHAPAWQWLRDLWAAPSDW